MTLSFQLLNKLAVLRCLENLQVNSPLALDTNLDPSRSISHTNTGGSSACVIYNARTQIEDE